MAEQSESIILLPPSRKSKRTAAKDLPKSFDPNDIAHYQGEFTKLHDEHGTYSIDVGFHSIDDLPYSIDDVSRREQ